MPKGDKSPRNPVERDEYGLTLAERAFADAWLGEAKQNSADAYTLSGYAKLSATTPGYDPPEIHRSKATKEGHRILNRPLVVEYIQGRRAELEEQARVSQAEIVRVLSQIIYSDIGEFLDVTKYGRAYLNLTQEMIESHATRFIKRVSMNRNGYSIEMYNKLEAIDALARMLGYGYYSRGKEDTDAADKRRAELQQLAIQEMALGIGRQINPELTRLLSQPTMAEGIRDAEFADVARIDSSKEDSETQRKADEGGNG